MKVESDFARWHRGRMKMNIIVRVQTCGLGGMKPNTVILGWPNSWRKREDDSTKVFVDTIRNAGAGKMALLVPKGIQRFPDTGDTVKVDRNGESCRAI